MKKDGELEEDTNTAKEVANENVDAAEAEAETQTKAKTTDKEYKYEYLEIDVDVHRFSFLARSGVHTLLGRIPNVDVGISVLLESRYKPILAITRTITATKAQKLRIVAHHQHRLLSRPCTASDV